MRLNFGINGWDTYCVTASSERIHLISIRIRLRYCFIDTAMWIFGVIEEVMMYTYVKCGSFVGLAVIVRLKQPRHDYWRFVWPYCQWTSTTSSHWNGEVVLQNLYVPQVNNNATLQQPFTTTTAHTGYRFLGLNSCSSLFGPASVKTVTELQESIGSIRWPTQCILLLLIQIATPHVLAAL